MLRIVRDKRSVELLIKLQFKLYNVIQNDYRYSTRYVLINVSNGLAEKLRKTYKVNE